jgi:hypothetical protein
MRGDSWISNRGAYLGFSSGRFAEANVHVRRFLSSVILGARSCRAGKDCPVACVRKFGKV